MSSECVDAECGDIHQTPRNRNKVAPQEGDHRTDTSSDEEDVEEVPKRASRKVPSAKKAATPRASTAPAVSEEAVDKYGNDVAFRMLGIPISTRMIFIWLGCYSLFLYNWILSTMGGTDGQLTFAAYTNFFASKEGQDPKYSGIKTLFEDKDYDKINDAFKADPTLDKGFVYTVYSWMENAPLFYSALVCVGTLITIMLGRLKNNAREKFLVELKKQTEKELENQEQYGSTSVAPLNDEVNSVNSTLSETSPEESVSTAADLASSAPLLEEGAHSTARNSTTSSTTTSRRNSVASKKKELNLLVGTKPDPKLVKKYTFKNGPSCIGSIWYNFYAQWYGCLLTMGASGVAICVTVHYGLVEASYTCMAVLGFASAFFQAVMFGLCASLDDEKTMIAQSTGQGVAGIFAGIVSFFPQPEWVLYLTWGICTATTLPTMFLVRIFAKHMDLRKFVYPDPTLEAVEEQEELERIKVAIKKSNDAESPIADINAEAQKQLFIKKKERCDLMEASKGENEPRPFLQVLGDAWMMILSIFLVFLTTFGCLLLPFTWFFQGKDDNRKPDELTNLGQICIFVFQLCDVIGRFAPSLYLLPNKCSVFISVLVRCGLMVVFVFYSVMAKRGVEEFNRSNVLQNVIRFGLVALMAVSNGYLATCGFIYAPRGLKNGKEQQIVGTIMGCAVVFGILAGTFVNKFENFLIDGPFAAGDP